MKYEVRVTKVVDGDTFNAVAKGVFFDITQTKPIVVRFLGTDAPEMKGAELRAGKVSKEWLKDLIEGKLVEIETDKTDDFDRWLSVVYYEGRNLNEEMVEKGLAEVWVPRK